MNLNYILITLIVILIVCIIIRIISKNKNEQFRGLINRQIMRNPPQETSEKSSQEMLDSSNISGNENPENPNDEQANQTVINLNKINNSVNEKVEGFLFLDTPFKSSINYIIVSIENLILKIFKTKSGYIITNKEVDKVYVPYKQKLQPVPFNPYIPVSRIPKYLYMNVIPYRGNEFYLRKGDYYYYPYKGGLYSWYHWNNYRNKKETRNLIQGLYDKIKHLEEKAFKNPPPPPPPKIIKEYIQTPSNSNVPPQILPPSITITNNNTNPGNSTTSKSLEDKLNKLPIIETPEIKNMGSTNIIDNPMDQNVKINDAPSELIDRDMKKYAEPEPVQKVEAIPEPVIEPEPIQKVETISETNKKIEDNPDDILSIIDSNHNKVEENNIDNNINNIETKVEPNSDIPELPKETFWSKLGF